MPTKNPTPEFVKYAIIISTIGASLMSAVIMYIAWNQNSKLPTDWFYWMELGLTWFLPAFAVFFVFAVAIFKYFATVFHRNT